MVDSIPVELFKQWWPVMQGSPGMTVALIGAGIAIGAVASWWLRGYIVKYRIEALNERVGISATEVKVADRHRDHAEKRLLDLSEQHSAMTEKLRVLEVGISRMETLMQTNASHASLTAASGSISAHLIDVGKANTELGSTISAIQFGSGKTDFVYSPYDPDWIGLDERSS